MTVYGSSLSDPARLVKDLAATSPTFVLSVPQVFEKIYETALVLARALTRGDDFEMDLRELRAKVERLLEE